MSRASIAKAKKHKISAEAAKASSQSSSVRAPVANQHAAKAPVAGQPAVIALPPAQPIAGPISVKETAMPNDITKVDSTDFNAFISNLEASPSYSANPAHVEDTSDSRLAAALPGKEAITKAVGMKKNSFMGLFRNNHNPCIGPIMGGLLLATREWVAHLPICT
ncbi:hypothetical protein Salat_2437800 [Sesamum alatum]|uniref:Uncharacterized protein n=1 Tax=Sesamum alatum TaxID=300844 RepID=A0AAE1XYH2_9LAMI|nr:hypothetical protein Salat_2437800 [Sesamum alatum]